MGYFLDNWGSFIGAISLVVTVAGFALAIYRVGQAQKAAAAAEEASRETRAAITRVLTVVDLERAIALVERLKDFHRGGRWESSLALYPALKITLSDIRSRHPDPTPELRQQLDESILQINEMENKVDQTIGDGSEQLEHQAFNIILNSIESSLLDISYSIQSFQERDR